MGKAKKLGIAVGVVGLSFFLLAIIGTTSSDPQELQEGNRAIEQQKKIETVNDRYYGLTENQIMKVKMIEESCELKTFEIEISKGKTLSEYYAKKCEQSVLKTIEGYR